MADPEQNESIVDRLSRQGEEALGKIAEELIANPVVSGAIARALEAREKAVLAQEAAMGALNIPSAADVERLTRRLRSVSQRMEGIEEAVDRLDQRLAGMSQSAGLDERLAAIEGQLSKLVMEISHLSNALDAAPQAPPREQERLKVDEPPPAPAKPKGKPAKGKKS